MAMPKETIYLGAPLTCKECGKTAEIGVCHTNNGYFVGSKCLCGIYTRETIFLSSNQEAEKVMENMRKGDESKLQKISISELAQYANTHSSFVTQDFMYCTKVN